MKRLLVLGCGRRLYRLGRRHGAPPGDDNVDDEPDAGPTVPTPNGRAQLWVDAKVPYCQAANHERDYDSACAMTCERPDNTNWDPYRSDCSGFVSWAWKLPAPGRVDEHVRAVRDGHHERHRRDGPRARRRGEQQTSTSCCSRNGRRRASRRRSWKSRAAARASRTRARSPRRSQSTSYVDHRLGARHAHRDSLSRRAQVDSRRRAALRCAS